MECPKCKSKSFVKNGIVPQRTPWEDALGIGLAWVKAYGEKVERTFPVDKTKKHGKVIEMDEMWHYVT